MTAQPKTLPQDAADKLLAMVDGLSKELHPGHHRTFAVDLDSSLEKDLGLDSLGRMELLVRLESTFGTSLPESVIAVAETPRELLRALLSTEGTAWAPDPEIATAPELEAVADTPYTVRTLPEMLEWHVQSHADRPHIYFYEESGEIQEISYGQLLEGAVKVAATLHAQGLQPGQSVAIMLPSGPDYFFSFYGILFAGAIPVPIYPPARLSQIEDHLRRHARILDNAQAVTLITIPRARQVARFLKSQVRSLKHIVAADELTATSEAFSAHMARPGDIAFLQYTSGSTGNPKGVALSHTNLLTNVRAMGAAVEAGSSDVFVSWLPLYHDMGLIGAWLGSLYFASPLVLMSPLAFLARPQRWLWAIHQHRGTLSAAPNFAYELCLKKISDEDIEGLDLSSWRLAFNGAEPVSPRTIERFCERFADYGFDRSAMTPVYGLAENAVGLAFPPLGRGPVIDRIDREALSLRGEACPAIANEQDVLEFVACGKVLKDHKIRVVDAEGNELPERREGVLQFQGPSATSGYYRNPEATRRLFHGEWLDSNDLAYMVDGDIYLTSRVKDIIIRAGRNIYPYEVEEAVGDIAGIRKGCVAIFGSKDPASGTERIVLLAETRETDSSVLEHLMPRVIEVASDHLGMAPDDVQLVPPHTVLKTSSGKIRHDGTREIYEQGKVGRSRPAPWRQFFRLGTAGLGSQLLRAGNWLSEMAYAAYAWMLLVALAIPVWILVAVLPVAKWRWWLINSAGGILVKLAGIPLSVKGLENLPRSGGFVLVCNHSSYLDGILLVTALPHRFSFVAKAELARKFIAGLFLRRIGTEFVERTDVKKGVSDTRHISEVAREGRSFMFFPEGTITLRPAIRPFRMGAFITAAENQLPVVPVVLHGTRGLLPGNSWRPRRGMASMVIDDPIEPAGDSWSDAVKLRDQVRTRILQLSGLPEFESGE